MNSETFHLPFSPLWRHPSDRSETETVSPLPESYGGERLVALPRDPFRLWLYWELSDKKRGELQRGLEPGQALEIELHLYFAAGRLLALSVPCRLEDRGHYLKAPVSGETYYAELGLKRAGRPFMVLLRSNETTLPYGFPADGRELPALELPTSLQHFIPPRP